MSSCSSGVGQEAAEPFWAGQGKALQWCHPETNACVRFKATLVKPHGSGADPRGDIDEAALSEAGRLPLMVYFCGTGSTGGMEELRVDALSRLIPGPVVMVAPVKTGHIWWVLSSNGGWGYLDGELLDTEVRLYASWIKALGDDPSIDSDWITVVGYSAGAYAASEIFACGMVSLRSVVLGGIHGHGQPDLEGVDGKRVNRGNSIIGKWRSYIDRMSSHSGAVGGIFGAHHRGDTVCPWKHAVSIFHAMEKRQLELGLPRVHLMEVSEEDKHEHHTKRKAKKGGHNYIDQTVLRADLLEQILPVRDYARTYTVGCRAVRPLMAATRRTTRVRRRDHESLPFAVEIARGSGACGAAHLAAASRDYHSVMRSAIDGLFGGCARLRTLPHGRGGRSRSRSRSR